MNRILRPSLVLPVFSLALLAGTGGCSSVKTAATTAASSVERVAERIFHPATPASPTAAPPAGLDDYKTQVARHVVQHNPERNYEGRLPPMLPAIVVLEITVDQDGELTGVEVQRSRDPDASQVALASMRRSTPLPPPRQLAQAGRLTFSETFLFADSQRYQLRSLAAPQPVE